MILSDFELCKVKKKIKEIACYFIIRLCLKYAIYQNNSVCVGKTNKKGVILHADGRDMLPQSWAFRRILKADVGDGAWDDVFQKASQCSVISSANH